MYLTEMSEGGKTVVTDIGGLEWDHGLYSSLDLSTSPPTLLNSMPFGLFGLPLFVTVLSFVIKNVSSQNPYFASSSMDYTTALAAPISDPMPAMLLA